MDQNLKLSSMKIVIIRNSNSKQSKGKLLWNFCRGKFANFRKKFSSFRAMTGYGVDIRYINTKSMDLQEEPDNLVFPAL